MAIVHFQQTNPDGRLSCVPACTKMLLGHQGTEVSEARLCDILETDKFGTPLPNLQKLQTELTIDLEFVWEKATIIELEESVKSGETPMIVIAAPEEERQIWVHENAHTVLVVKFEGEHVWIHDPCRPSGPTKLPSTDLLELWLAANSVLFFFRPVKE